jgi:hypothetical protein
MLFALLLICQLYRAITRDCAHISVWFTLMFINMQCKTASASVILREAPQTEYCNIGSMSMPMATMTGSVVQLLSTATQSIVSYAYALPYPTLVSRLYQQRPSSWLDSLPHVYSVGYSESAYAQLAHPFQSLLAHAAVHPSTILIRPL